MTSEVRPPLRRQQAEALAAVDAAWRVGRHAAWVVLPPGGGKTRVGLEAIERFDDPAVVFVPNTAVQGQWIEQALRLGHTASDSRDLRARVTVLTYQALAVFADEDDVEEAVDADVGALEERHLDRLHPNAQALVRRLVGLGPVTLVLDECHHLLDVWGELLAEVLDLLPQARVLALTATPPEVLSADEATLVERLFGDIVYVATIPGFVRDGHLAPFRELVSFTEPTAGEAEYLQSTALRFAQLRSDLMTPGLTSMGFLDWLDERFVRRGSAERGPRGVPSLSWPQLVREQPDLADAVLRASHAGLLSLPVGASPREQHRAPLDGDDWSLLIDDFVRGALIPSTDPRDLEVLERLRVALPGVGLRLTKRGLVRATSPVDRVVARSAAKAVAAVGIADLESQVRGDRLRLLVLCDFETAGAQVPEGLVGVIAPEEGSARGVLRRLMADPVTRMLRPVLVTGRTVACHRDHARDLAAWLQAADPALQIEVAERDGIAVLEGGWNAKRWVPLLTRWFESGEGQVLIGTRGLLGEGWDARRVNVLVDLTTATTAVSVTQTRGRALRTDPEDPLKVAHTWTVVCVADGHPLGDRDYHRFVRKHAGFYAVTDDGLITDGVAHVNPDLAPYAPPSAEERAGINADAVADARDHDQTRALWRIGQPYEDAPIAEIRVRAARTLGIEVGSVAGGHPISSVLTPAGDGRVHLRSRRDVALRQWLGGSPDEVEAAAQAGTLSAFAAAVADGLAATGWDIAGATQVRIAPTTGGSYRIWLEGVGEASSQAFADALDEVLMPLASPRYVVPRYVIPPSTTKREARRLAWRMLWRRPIEATVVWHAVPSVLGARRELVDAFAEAWHRWVSPGMPLYTGAPDGAGVLAAQRGDDPFSVETTMRVEWR
ncbi:MAG: DEAD/DEAH box helicase [Actinomycetales bacterium]|nr:DEAD/DEAH box helicase [Actinomycetales bacterium]